MTRSGCRICASGGGYLYSYRPPAASKPPLIVVPVRVVERGRLVVGVGVVPDVRVAACGEGHDRDDEDRARDGDAGHDGGVLERPTDPVDDGAQARHRAVEHVHRPIVRPCARVRAPPDRTDACGPAGRVAREDQGRTMPAMYANLSESRRRAIRHGLAIAGVLAAAWMYLVVGDRTWAKPAADGLVYWGVNISAPYAGSTVGGANAYLYSPAFAQIFAIIGLVPQPVFTVVWTVFLAGVAWWLARPWPASLLVLALPVSQEILIGNIHLLLAAAIVLGFRWAGTWSFVLLTKVTPGVGLVWFAVRREWTALATAIGVTALIAGVSFVIAPQLWRDWITLLTHDGGSAGELAPAADRGRRRDRRLGRAHRPPLDRAAGRDARAARPVDGLLLDAPRLRRGQRPRRGAYGCGDPAGHRPGRRAGLRSRCSPPSVIAGSSTAFAGSRSPSSSSSTRSPRRGSSPAAAPSASSCSSCSRGS